MTSRRYRTYGHIEAEVIFAARIRALELAISSLNDHSPASTDKIIERAASFFEYVAPVSLNSSAESDSSVPKADTC